MIQKNCLQCTKTFFTYPNRIKIGKGKFCSKICSNNFNIKEGDKHPQWEGDKVGYWGIHDWLIKVFGRADKCENQSCNHKSKKFMWAKLADKEYERKRENFWKLCASCHVLYDMTDEWRRKTSLAQIGRVPWNKGLKIKV